MSWHAMCCSAAKGLLQVEGGLLNGHIAARRQSGTGEHSLASSWWVARAGMLLHETEDTALHLRLWCMLVLTWKLENGDTILGSDCRLGDPAAAACAPSLEGAAAGASERLCAVTSAGLCPS